jgi:hypothetical protein
MVEARLGSNSFWARRISLVQTAWQKLLSPEELENRRGRARVQKLLSQKDWGGQPGNSCSYLKTLRMVEARLGSNSSGLGGSGWR